MASKIILQAVCICSSVIISGGAMRIQLAANKKIDYLVPIIADADAGFGGITSVMKLVKLFVEAGAGGIHIEDQKPGVKKCGHLGGKVLVSAKEMVTRLQAARL